MSLTRTLLRPASSSVHLVLRAGFASATKYTKSHEWVRLETGDVASIGITNYAQGALGDIVFVDLPDVGKKVSAGKSFGNVESVKSASDLYAPVDGVVSATNAVLKDAPETVNKSAEKDGWMIKIKVLNASTVDKLMDEKAYQDFLKSEGH